MQRVLEETKQHYHVIQKFVILGDLDGKTLSGPLSLVLSYNTAGRAHLCLFQVCWRSSLIG